METDAVEHRDHDLARGAHHCAGFGILFGMAGAAALLSLLVSPVPAAPLLAPFVGNLCSDPAPAPAHRPDHAMLASERLHRLIQAHRAYVRTCPVNPACNRVTRSSTDVVRRGKAPGRLSRDCVQCPELVVAPAGSVMMQDSPPEFTRAAPSTIPVPPISARAGLRQGVLVDGRDLATNQQALGLGHTYGNRCDGAERDSGIGHPSPVLRHRDRGAHQRDVDHRARDPLVAGLAPVPGHRNDDPVQELLALQTGPSTHLRRMTKALFTLRSAENLRCSGTP